jgi:hypothetical protein
MRREWRECIVSAALCVESEREVFEITMERLHLSLEADKTQQARVYCHRSPGGFGLILVRDTASVPMQRSHTAMLILEGLKALGLLDHTILVERGKRENRP